MTDNEILAEISQLMDEEHELLEASEGKGPNEGRQRRLQEIHVRLDQQGDLLRQRRARRGAGLDPDEAKVREARTVEHYLQ